VHRSVIFLRNSYSDPGAGPVQSYSVWLRSGRPDDRGSILRRGKYFFSTLYVLLTSSGAHPASYPTDVGDPISGDKSRPGREADHSFPFSAEVMKEKELYLLFPCASIVCVCV
jgi:hypothetical protein